MFWQLLAFTLIPSSVLAQEASPTIQPTQAPPTATPTPNLVAQYSQDYSFQYNLYQQSYLRYLDKKQTYTRYGTVATQKEKFDSAKETIINRNNTFKAYLMTIRTGLDQYKNANPTETEKNQIELSKWESYFQEQNTIISAINNDIDLKNWVTTFQEKYIDIQQAIYTSLTQHELNKRNITNQHLHQLADSIKNSPQITTTSNQWYSDLTVQFDLINQLSSQALALTKKDQYQIKFSNFYSEVQNNLSLIDGYQNQIFNNLKIIITKGK